MVRPSLPLSEITKRLNTKNLVLLTNKIQNLKSEVRVKCKVCDHKWTSIGVRQLWKYQTPCPKCASVVRSQLSSRPMHTQTEIRRRLKDVSHGTLKLVEPFSKIENRHKIKCLVCKRIWQPTLHSVLNNKNLCGNGCQTGVRSLRLTAAEFKAELKKTHPNIKLLTDYSGMLKDVTAVCTVHNIQFDTIARNFIRGVGCQSCAKFAKVFRAEHKTFLLRGREPQALAWILKETKYSVKDVSISPPYFSYVFNSKEHQYRPDFLVGSNIIVEVKSLESAGLHGSYYEQDGCLFERLKAKATAVLSSGYKFRLLVMDASGAKILMPKNWHTKTKAQVIKYINH